MSVTTEIEVDFPYTLTRMGIVMTPEEGNAYEAEGVLNPGSGHTPDGTLYLLPRLVATGNVSRVGLARVIITDGVPTGVEREGVVLAPDQGWERGANNAGVEDPRVTWIPLLGLHVMTYVAYGPLGPRTAVAVSDDLRAWRRLGPALFTYDEALDMDLNLFHNKDTVFFPEPVVAPNGVLSFAVLHRPMWDLGEVKPGEGVRVPAGITDTRQSIWISYIPVDAVMTDGAVTNIGRLALWEGHRFLAGSEYPFEQLKIGGGPAPIRVPEGWLLMHHGVTGVIDGAFSQQQKVNYAAGAMILDADDPTRVIRRTSVPLLKAETKDETDGIVPNVVFPTAIEEIEGQLFVFYGMADSKIGVARLDRVAE
ncbi:glycosidase [Cryobacterium frigoriphilum]|uniref:Glycosidase n=1 Tax=Cryobacterium frigoriphilum TaxID=1259150 RepID=A0A4R9A2S3_9MICO|nr:glycosidase [Cryobacterium frigoriphilum]TFD51209.1 glycosidase [Cryobacterium frigoriphilum]